MTAREELPADREARLIAEAEAENAVDALHDFQESLGAKPSVGKDANFLMRGWVQTWGVPRLMLMKLDKRTRRNKRTKS